MISTNLAFFQKWRILSITESVIIIIMTVLLPIRFMKFTNIFFRGQMGKESQQPKIIETSLRASFLSVFTFLINLET